MRAPSKTFALFSVKVIFRRCFPGPEFEVKPLWFCVECRFEDALPMRNCCCVCVCVCFLFMGLVLCNCFFLDFEFWFEDAYAIQNACCFFNVIHVWQLFSRTRTWGQLATTLHWTPHWRWMSHADYCFVFCENQFCLSMFSRTRTRGQLVTMLHGILVRRCMFHARCLLVLWTSYVVNVF